MKKILYYSPVDWDWIKQRPQFIALNLAERNLNIRVIYLRQYRKKGLIRVEKGQVQLCPIYRIPPLGYRFTQLNKINQWIVRYKVAKEINRFEPDILWLTHPMQLQDIPDTFRGQIVYDCMDDYDVLGTDSTDREAICALEYRLCNRANLIFVSSSLLQKKICNRNPNKVNQVHLIRNGCDGRLYPRVAGSNEGKLYAGYVGTIAEWFDFELLTESLNRIPNLEYFLVGPVCVENPPVHERIHYLGTIAHHKLFDTIKNMDCMVMPFRLDEVVLSVDPVKIYEYISWQKNIIAIDYPEIQRFKDFVYTYTNADQYCAALVWLKQLQTVSYSESEASKFLSNNSWEKRAESILGFLSS